MEKIALVTGSSRGIGRAVAAELARQGWAVCINYRLREDCARSLLEQLTAEGCRAMMVQADVSQQDQVTAMVRQVEETFGPVSLLVNNAGVAGQALFQDITPELWHRYFSVNVDGAFHTIQAVLPHMLHQHAGCIVNISSIWGQRGASCEVTYSCTKAALIGLTRSLAMELAPTHIRVNCVAPGVIRTDMLDALPPEVLPQLAQGHTGGHCPRRGLPGRGAGILHHRPGAHLRRRLHPVKKIPGNGIFSFTEWPYPALIDRLRNFFDKETTIYGSH